MPKKHSRGLIVTLLDLRNAFGEVHHGLIRSALKYHHVPNIFSKLFNSIYDGSQVAVSVNNVWSENIMVHRGVLQGDPTSPLIFNMCFNLLMKTLSQSHFKELGYLYKSQDGSPNYRSWFQFADDAAIVSSNVKDSQSLLDLFIAWCDWSDMHIRIDKCCVFGMAKVKNVFSQILPVLFVSGQKIPVISLGDYFKYLGKIFDFEAKNSKAKEMLVDKLNSLLKITSAINCKVQIKLKILKSYIHSQILFELKTYSFPVTWVEQNLDNICFNFVRTWTEQPICSCVKESASLPKNEGGLNIPTIKSLSEKMLLLKRNALKNSKCSDISLLGLTSTQCTVNIDTILCSNQNIKAAQRQLKEQQHSQAAMHFYSLPMQGAAAKIVTECISSHNIALWSACLENVTTFIHNFAIKAFKQTLPTAKNLSRWGKAVSPLCPLCNLEQTNKHVLSNCSSTVALDRYTQRHNEILAILMRWLSAAVSKNQLIFADLPGFNNSTILFNSYRPDICIAIDCSTIAVLELTVCHELNLLKSKQYKIDKYKNLVSDLRSSVNFTKLKLFTLEVSTLGFISDSSELTDYLNISKLSVEIKKEVINTVLNYSYWIYCHRFSQSMLFPVHRDTSVAGGSDFLA
ncbi:MAG: reverse transcriptase domain-containing protein [Nitrososphaeraceae archaeon]|nr:reverse transcriptase domain-containing protein [Nitrososphaeraceae archaeon]